MPTPVRQSVLLPIPASPSRSRTRGVSSASSRSDWISSSSRSLPTTALMPFNSTACRLGEDLAREARRRAGDPAFLHESAVEVEQQDRAEQRKDQAAGGAEEEPRDDPANERAAEPEPDRRVPGHWVGAGEREPRQAAD